MNTAEVGAFFAQHYTSDGDALFRLEALPAYTVADDGPNYQLWLDGAPEPDPKWKGAWLDTLRAERSRGLRASRLRIFGEQLTDYERYACEFGYALNGPAGEDIRVLHRSEHDIPPGLVVQDFWIVNSQHVIVMHYDDIGRFEDATLLDQPDNGPYLRTQLVGMAAAEPFMPWWERHTELHRRVAA